MTLGCPAPFAPSYEAPYSFPNVLAFLDHLGTKVHMVKFNAWSLPNRIEQSILEHRSMIAALERRDAETFEKLVIDHLLFSKNSYMGQLKAIVGKGTLKTLTSRSHTGRN
jgi:hypothetical protein